MSQQYDRPSEPFLSDGSELIDAASNEARVIITLTRQGDSISGFVELIEGVDFDPGDVEDFPGRDVLRLAAELLLTEAGYDAEDVQRFLDTASRRPVEIR